jgi:hypothetical protein
MMNDVKKKYLWVFGNAVQDITVEVDIERLSRELDDKRNLIHLAEQGPQIKPNIWLKTQIGSQEFGVEVELQDVELARDGMYLLEGGRKYMLKESIKDSRQDIPEPSLFLPCENLSWGGGGANVVTFLRALTPSAEIVPIRYTDIAMSRSLPDVIRRVIEVLEPFKDTLSIPDSSNFDLLSFLQSLYEIDRVKAEYITRKIAAIAAYYSPDRSLSVYLASLSVESVLYRPRETRFRRNWVFNRFRSAYREVNNKIILKGKFNPLPDEEKDNIAKFLQAYIDDVGAIHINSLKDAPLFKAAYSLCKDACKNENFVTILAMTETTQECIPWMIDDKGESGGKFPPFILVLNETEAHKLAMALGGDKEPFMKGNDLPDMCKFAKMASKLREHFNKEGMPRIYVTLGERGSLGVDSGGHVIYVSSFSKRGATVFDTNACGDAYCSAIALLEWAKRHGYPDIADVKGRGIYPRGIDPRAREMHYFMAVATAAAYCKATNRRGRVYAAELRDLLQYNHLASDFLWTVDSLLNLTQVNHPECIDENFRLREPAEARYVGITQQLSDLIA